MAAASEQRDGRTVRAERTRQALVDSLLGARLGASSIPAPWLDQVERRAEIEGLTQRLVAMAA